MGELFTLEVGDGANVNFWFAIWCGDHSLKEAFPEFFLLARNKNTLAADHLQIQNASIHWELDFSHPVQDLDLESIISFLDLLYSSSGNERGVDRLCWQRSTLKGFAVRSLYKALLLCEGRGVPWKVIWKPKVPPQVVVFVWTAVMGRILTIDNLRRRTILVVDWCCMCKRSGELIDHLLLHCMIA
jgi:hypothetical protein